MIQEIQAILKAEQLNFLREVVSKVSVENKLLEYIAQIVNQTRTHGGLILGGSPRASVTILNTSKALAAIRGRDFVTPEDIIEVAKPAMRHRLALTAEKEMDGATTDDIIQEIIKGIEIPRS
jgi:MoxR-like ATPase